jgi:hypothetical protein
MTKGLAWFRGMFKVTKVDFESCGVKQYLSWGMRCFNEPLNPGFEAESHRLRANKHVISVMLGAEKLELGHFPVIYSLLRSVPRE